MREVYIKIKAGDSRSSKKRIWRRACGVFAAFCAFISIFSVRAMAYAENDLSLIDESGEAILGDFMSILPEGMEDLASPDASSDAVGMTFLLECIINTVNGRAGEITVFLLMLIGVSMLSSLSALRDGDTGRVCKGCVAIISSALILDKIFALVDEVGDALASINDFYASVIPVVTAVNMLGLSFSTASAQSVGMTISLGVYSFLCGDFLYSFVGALSALAALSSIEGTILDQIAKSVRKAFLWAIGILTAFVGATFSLQSLISYSADSAVMRGAKYAVSGMIPIVGGSISAALSLLSGSFGYLRGVVGGGSIAVIIAFTIAPLTTLLLYRACFAIAVFFSEVCSKDGAPGAFGAFSFALDSLIAVYSLSVVVYVIQLAVFLKGGGVGV